MVFSSWFGLPEFDDGEQRLVTASLQSVDVRRLATFLIFSGDFLIFERPTVPCDRSDPVCFPPILPSPEIPQAILRSRPSAASRTRIGFPNIATSKGDAR
jgi:hypothetical protein